MVSGIQGSWNAFPVDNRELCISFPFFAPVSSWDLLSSHTAARRHLTATCVTAERLESTVVTDAAPQQTPRTVGIYFSTKILLPLKQSGWAFSNCSHSLLPQNGLRWSLLCRGLRVLPQSFLGLCLCLWGKRGHQQRCLWRGKMAVTIVGPSMLCVAHPFSL